MSAATDVHSRAQTMLAQAESQRVLKAPLGDLPCLRQATTAKSGKPGSGTGSWSGGVSGNHRRSGQRACREPGMQADTLAASDQAALAAAGLSDVRLRFPPPLVFYAADDTPPSCLDKVGCVCSVCVCACVETRCASCGACWGCWRSGAACVQRYLEYRCRNATGGCQSCKQGTRGT